MREQLPTELARRGLTALCVTTIAIGTIGIGAVFADQQVNDADHNVANQDNNTSESEVAVAASGPTVVVGWNDSRQFAGGIGSVTSMTGYGYSTDGGATFSDAGQLAPIAGNVLLGDPAIAVDGAGNFYFASLAVSSLYTFGNSRVVVARSTCTSPTVTFGTPVAIAGLNTSSSAFQDKELIAVDDTGGTYDGRVYVTWSDFASLYDSTPAVLLARSTSTTPLAFATPTALTPRDVLNHGAMPAVAPNGNVYVVWGRYAGSSESIRLLKSVDGGMTFINPDPSDPAANKTVASPTPAPSNLPGGGASPRTRDFPYLAIDKTPVGSPTRGRMYIAFQADPDGAGADRSDIFVTKSSDGGATWSTPRSVNKGPAVTAGADPTTNDNWLPTLAVSPDNGEVTVTFYDRRSDPANGQITVYKAVSTDGGDTWANSSVSSAAFTPTTGYDPALNSSYMGDYNYSAASGSAFHMVWTDLRNLCAPPGGATAPCSSAGRPDMDVFYDSAAAHTGADPTITPWGHVTGVGPEWKSPDIFVVDATDTVVNAVKGQINKLRARIRNVGDAPATNVTVRFKYAPWFAGITDAVMKEIGTTTVNLVAAGSPSGNDVKIAPIDWDLTDLTDTNGGLWPMPVSAYVHFCVKVTIEYGSDANPTNNLAQTNFFDVPTVGTTAPLAFLVGNPFDRNVRAVLQLSDLPDGYGARIVEGPIRLGSPFPMKPGEIIPVMIQFVGPEPSTLQQGPTDVVANVDLQVDGETVGGISARLYKAEGGRIRDYPADCRKVFEATVEAIKQLDEPLALVDPEKLLINTGSVDVDRERLLSIVSDEAVKAIEQGEPSSGTAAGRYLLSFRVQCLDEGLTRVEVEPLIIASVDIENPLGGQPVPSNGQLEAAHLDAIARALR